MKSFVNQSSLTRILIGLMVMFAAWQCNKPKEWLDPSDKTAPNPVSNVQVTNVNGGAIIEFSRPSDKDLMGVKAIYRFNENDQWRQRYASAYSDTIILEGYGDTNEHIVELFAVDKSGNLSTPVQTTIKPLIPLIDMIRKSLDVQQAFGGVRTEWENPLGSPMSITLYYTDQSGERVLYYRYFSSGIKDKYTFRGLPAEETEFHIELCDRWGNFSLPLDTVITPKLEVKIVGKDAAGKVWWSVYESANAQKRGEAIPNLFASLYDGVLVAPSTNCFNIRPNWTSVYGEALELFPMYFILDMGRKASYTQMIWYPRQNNYGYQSLDFEIWGANEVKPVSEVGDGSIQDNHKYWTSWSVANGADQWKEDWTKIATCFCVFPTGRPNTIIDWNADEIAFMVKGIQYEFDEDKMTIPFQYLRFEFKSTNMGYQNWASEWEFYGAYAE